MSIQFSIQYIYLLFGLSVYLPHFLVTSQKGGLFTISDLFRKFVKHGWVFFLRFRLMDSSCFVASCPGTICLEDFGTSENVAQLPCSGLRGPFGVLETLRLKDIPTASKTFRGVFVCVQPFEVVWTDWKHENPRHSDHSSGIPCNG